MVAIECVLKLCAQRLASVCASRFNACALLQYWRSKRLCRSIVWPLRGLPHLRPKLFDAGELAKACRIFARSARSRIGAALCFFEFSRSRQHGGERGEPAGG